MKYQKLIPFLLIMILWVNYTNYFQVDEKKLQTKINILEAKTLKEEKLTELYFDKESLKKLKEKSTYKQMFMDEKLNYSKAMGILQDTINNSAKNQCKVEYLKWGSKVPSNEWYETLKMDVRMLCRPKSFVVFKNKIVKTKKLYKFENFKIIRIDKKKKLLISYQFIAYKLRK